MKADVTVSNGRVDPVYGKLDAVTIDEHEALELREGDGEISIVDRELHVEPVGVEAEHVLALTRGRGRGQERDPGRAR